MQVVEGSLSLSETKKYSINGRRLLERINALARIGQNAHGGIDRQLGSAADFQSRELLKKWWQQAGLVIRTDAIANMWVMAADSGDEKKIVLGSHNDSVPDGGKLDGALGVLTATEVMETLQENNIKLKHPLCVVSFTGEEPSSFNVSTLGTKVLSGRLQEKDLAQLTDKNNGESLEAAIKRLGGNIHKTADILMTEENDIAAFVECHIEQGRRLFDKNELVAEVSAITGIYREYITLKGEANHAGTTRLHDRRDAMSAAAELCLAIENIMRLPDMEDLAITVGQLALKPNSMSIIPGEVILSIDLRTAEPAKRQRALNALAEAIDNISEKRQVKISREVNLNQLEMPMDETVRAALQTAIVQNGQPERTLVSMAGHDAANMARVTKAGMLFVQSIDGYSHCPKEKSTDEAIIMGAQVLLDTVLELDRRL